MDALEAYLVELSANRLAGAVPETSGYGPLATLLNEVGRHLKPKVRCVINPANRGAGIPDGGFFVASQFQKGAAEPLPGQLPGRGALEVKPVSEDVHLVPEGEQVRRYLEKYRQVLVTTYREFVLVGYDADGVATLLESYSLSPTELGFWSLAASPRKAATLHGERLSEFLKRCLLRQAQIASPQDLAWFLASYAREARARAEERDLPALANTRAALEEALGMSFSGEKGDHFFRSTLVQTLFYGLFAAWVFWAEHHSPTDTQARFDWRSAARYLHIPILQKLFYDFANPAQLGALKLDEVLDWAAEALNRVDRASFFSTFEQSHAVQYFYEPFLEAFDPELRKELGVWYTPPEIVQYMVARVDTVLHEDLEIADGLADSRVVVLDPCCGTGAYLVEVLNKIAATLREKGDDALVAHDLKEAARSRVFGFEILPAPFVISHLQIGMFLDRQGAGFADEPGERAGVYLTNALTGWEPPTEPKQHLLFTEMEEERDKAQAVKQHAPILVILGNPPYNGFAGVSPEEEGGLVDAYKKDLVTEWGVKKFNLDDLYTRFWRVAERRIAATGRGVVCYVSNFSWLDGPSFVVMRKQLLGGFERAWIDCLNGDSRETGKTTPDGLPDPSIFSTPHNREGIRVGTAVALLVRKGNHTGAPRVLFREFWGAGKRNDILGRTTADSAYATLRPERANRYSMRRSAAPEAYLAWPAVTDIALVDPLNGPIERRALALISIERDQLEHRMSRYFDPAVSDGEVADTYASMMMTGNRIVGPEARRHILAKFQYDESRIVRYPFKPFDVRWCYLENLRPLFSEPSPRLLAEGRSDNVFFITRDRADAAIEGLPVYMSRLVCDYHLLGGEARHFPLTIHPPASPGEQLDLAPDESAALGNVSEATREYLSAIRVSSEAVWTHVLAIGTSAGYLTENARGIRQDWPRVPFPITRDALLASAELGRRVAALLDVEGPVDAVTTGSIRHELRPIGVIATADGRQLDPSAGDLAVTAGWGHAGKGGVTMPGRGRVVERPYANAELAAFREGLADLGLTYDQLTACLGGACYDVYLNDVAYWRCVPARVWKYTIGGYQVMKKWLSYRERALLGRDLKPEEARYVTEMTRRIAAILLLEPALDANYERVKADTYDWSGDVGGV